jgi:hypothetical protein
MRCNLPRTRVTACLHSVLVALLSVWVAGCSTTDDGGQAVGAQSSAQSACDESGRDWPRVIGDKNLVGPKAGMLSSTERLRAYASTEFRLPPRLVLASDVVGMLANADQESAARKRVEDEVKRALEDLQRDNPFSDTRWPYMIRVSDWALGVGGQFYDSVVSRPTVGNLYEEVVRISTEIASVYSESHPFFDEYHQVPGVIVEPLVGSFGQSRSPYRSSEEWAPELSGSCFFDQPGPHFGTYCVIAPGLRGGSYGGEVVREEHTQWVKRGASRDRIVVKRGVLDAGNEREASYSFDFEFPMDLQSTIWSQLRALRAALGHPFYIEWAGVRRGQSLELYLLQVAALHEPRAVVGSESAAVKLGSPLLSLSGEKGFGSQLAVYGGTGNAIRVRTLAVIPSEVALIAYINRMAIAPSRNPFGALQEKPHLLLIGEQVVTKLRTRIAWGRVVPTEAFRGVIGVFEIQSPDLDAGHEHSLPDHFGNGFVESGRFVMTAQLSSQEIEVLGLDDSFTQVLRELSTRPSANSVEPGGVVDVDWYITPNQALNAFDIYRVP